MDNLAVYSSYSVSYLPSAGDQFSALSPGLVIAPPEKFVNREVGLKYDILPSLQFAAAVYELDRTNQRFPDPNNAGFFTLEVPPTPKASKRRWAATSPMPGRSRAAMPTPTRASRALRPAPIVPGNRVGLVPLQHLLALEPIPVHPGLGRWRRRHSTTPTSLPPRTTRCCCRSSPVSMQPFSSVSTRCGALSSTSRTFSIDVYIATADGNNNITPGSPRVFRLSATANF